MVTIEKTFNCNPNESADFYNEENCCGWTPPCDDSIIYHTYLFDKEYKVKVLTLSSLFRIIYGNNINVIVEFLIDGSWVKKAEYSQYGHEHKTQIINFVPFNTTGFRVHGEHEYGDNPLFAYTYGSFLADEFVPPSCEDYTYQVDCENAGCYWYDNSCHTNPPSENGFPWVYVALGVVGTIAIIALLRKR